MINTSQFSSISLAFNDSWLAHIGSRIYRVVIEAIEVLSTALSYPLVQPYSGKRLYQLVDTFLHSAGNSQPYNEARLNYTDHLMKALEGQKNIFEKTKSVRTILNTHILGLSILQEKNKQSLTEHLGYTVLPSLINGFGTQMAIRALLALDGLDDPREKNLRQYAALYRDLTLQQSELDSFVKALQELNGNVSREILIHELLLSRNRHLTDAAKAMITSTLQDDHYIQVKLQRKLHLMEPLKNEREVDEKEIIRELQRHRDTQLEVLHYDNPSLFFPSESPISRNCQAADSDSTPTEASIYPSESPEMPIGIANTNQNCWYNSALQLLSNTSLYYAMTPLKDTFSEKFPKIAESVRLYRENYREQSIIRQVEHPSRYGSSRKLTQEIENKLKNNLDLRQKVRSYRENKRFKPLCLTDSMQGIRAEIHNKIDQEFKSWGATQEDSKQFLFRLLEKASLDVARTTTLTKDLHTLTNKYVFLDKPASQAVGFEELFFSTNYVPEGVLLHSDTHTGGRYYATGGHYYAAVRRNQCWYLCNDSVVQKISEERLQQEMQNNSAFIMARYVSDDEIKVQAVSETQISTPQSWLQKITTLLAPS